MNGWKSKTDCLIEIAIVVVFQKSNKNRVIKRTPETNNYLDCDDI